MSGFFSSTGQNYIDINDISVVQSQTFYPSVQQISSQTIDQYSGIPLAVSVVTNEISRVNLVLKPNVLIPGEGYTFRLSATNSEGTAYSQILVTADPPPQYAMMLAEPLSGLALETNFVFTVSGAIDYTTDSPFLYQFGLIEEQSLETNNSDRSVKWISGVQTSNSINTVLPSGNSTTNYSICIRGRIFDRKGGYSDVQTQIAVRPNIATGVFYSTVLTDIKATFDYNKDWATALSRLMATVLDINRNTGVVLPQTLKDEALDIFMDIFNEHLPATQSHYALAASLLDQITSNPGITGISNQRRITEALTTVVNWFKSQTANQARSTEAPSLSYGEPLLLQSTYEAMPKNLLTTTITQSILSSWVNMLQSQSTATVAQTFVQNTESISYTLCQQSILGENATAISIPLADLYVKSAPPVGAFNISGNLVDFGSSLLPVYRLQACNNRNTACSETCFQGIRYPSDFFANPDMQTIRLSTTTMERLLSEIEGSDPSSVILFSDVTSAVISVPSTNSFLEVRNLGTPIQVLVRKQQPVPNDGSRVLCLYRPVGGSNGFDSFEWQLDTLTAPMITTVNSTEYFVCNFTHLSEFAVGLLAPPVITQAPILTTSTSQIQPSSSSHTPVETPSMVTQETPTQPSTMVPVAGFPAPAVAIPLVLIIVVAVVAALAVVLCLMWKKKRQKKLKVSPEERPESTEASPDKKAKLIKAGPLTPEESKVPMNIIQLLDSGERTVVGTMNVLPSIRLRELRYQLGDHFGAFKNKPFYFLNRQLCEIEPAAEQQQFVSLVFGDKPIYVRKVTNNNEQIRHHFCICGNAAQFECSNCSSQGYCSTECQYKDWSEQHQKECSRLSEKRRRSEILLRRQSSILSPDETPRRATIAGPPSVGTQPTSPTDWKTFLSSSKPMRQQSMNLSASLPRTSVVQQDTPRTTLGQIAAVAQTFVQNTESISYTLCQQSILGENATAISIPLADLYVKSAPPVGAFNISGNLVDFGSSLLPVYRLQACNNRNTACSETCFQGIRYPSDFFANPDMQTIRLSTTTMERLLSEIEGSDPSSVILFSDVTSAVISVPSTNSFLEVRNLGTPIQVLVRKQQPVPNDGSRVLCLYRPVGGSNGFDSFEWQLDTLTAPMITTVNSTEYFVCNFTHLSEFAVGLLAPPVITQAPILTTSTSQIQPSSSSHTPVETPSMVTQETPTQPSTMVPVAGFPAPAVAIPLVLIIVVAVVAALAVVLCLMWKKKRQKKLKVSPEERPESTEASPDKKAKLIKAGPLTPEESKVPMNIIQLLDSGERTVVGTMNVLPSIRLRELRYQLGDHFGAFKNKPFYFLNRQLCEIEPAAEQQQFVSLVFGDKPIYVRKVTNNNEQIRHHFCICGNAAQFECSNCSSQGYCSTECQYKDWSEQHQKECSRLSEKRRRSEILLRRQSSILSPDETPRRATIAGPPSVGTQPTSPTDWKTFLSSSKPMRQQSMNLSASLPRTSVVQQDTPRTTLGQIAAQPPPSTTQEGAIGKRDSGGHV